MPSDCIGALYRHVSNLLFNRFRFLSIIPAMPHRQETIPIGTRTSEEKKRFPGAVAYIETFDTEEDVSDPADILSFESLREAFVTLHSVETELAKTIPKIEPSAAKTTDPLEQPDEEICDNPIEANLIDAEDDDSPLPQNIESPVVATRLDTIIEAMLFVGNRDNHPVDADHIADKLRNVSAEEVDQAVVRLNEHYQERNCPYTILSESNGYRMILRSAFESIRTNFYGKNKGTRLSQQAIDTLAVVAYRQPITAEEIQTIRKRPCSAVLSLLVRRNLLKISHEIQDEKNIVRYHTTSRFLELFQIQSLDDIPRADELDYR